MTITKEAIEAAADAYWGRDVQHGATALDQMRLALEAALPFLPIAVEGKAGLVPAKAAEFSQMVREYGANSDNDHGARMQEDLEMFLMENLCEIEAALTSSPGKDGGQEVEAEEWQGRYWIEDENRWSNWITNPVGYPWAYDPQEGKSEIRYLYPRPASTALVERRASEEVAVTNALSALNHALMVLDVPESSAKRRAWSSLIDARDALSTASQFDVMDATPGMVAAAMSVDWEADIPQEALVHNIWHAMFSALSSSSTSMEGER